MAQSALAGSNTINQATFLDFYDAYLAADAAVAEKVGERKDLRARLKGAGYNLAAFDRARKEAEKSGDRRELEDGEFRRNLAWLGKPLGFQAEMEVVNTAQPAPNGYDLAAVSEHQKRRIADAGEQAGLVGVGRDTNPWSPGTETYETWDNGWQNGAAQLAQSRIPEPGAPKPRGRPPGSRNRPKPPQPPMAA